MKKIAKKNPKHQMGALYFIREELGISQASLANNLGISQSKISKIEKLDLEMGLKEMMKLIIFFDLDPAYVFNMFLVHDFKDDEDLSDFRNLMQIEVFKIHIKKKNKQKLKIAS